MMNKIFWAAFLILTFIITLPASWWLLAKVDFGYAYLHDGIGISQHIDKYAPKNTQGKSHFELTTKGQRIELFHDIIEAIQSSGKGLERLAYIDNTDKKTVIMLFTLAEVIHLQDVANLIDKLKVIVLILFTLWLLILVILWKRKASLPSTKQLLASTALILLGSGAMLLLGPEAIFNQLHIWIFPDNHQWFFYYEESLMSTMMKAPDLFAYIAAMLALISIIMTTFMVKVLTQIGNYSA